MITGWTYEGILSMYRSKDNEENLSCDVDFIECCLDYMNDGLSCFLLIKMSLTNMLMVFDNMF